MIAIRGATKKYKSKRGIVVNALNNLSLEIEERGLVFIVGRSGCGKTTLLNCLGGLDRLDEGSIAVGGEDITKLSNAKLNEFRGKKIGFVFQEYNLIDHFTVMQNITLAQKVLGGQSDSSLAEKLMAELDISELKDRRADELSGGQRQRVAIVRALLKNPEIILADEPTGALDEETGEDLVKLLKAISKDTLVLVVTHDKETAFKYGDRIIELSDGRVKTDSDGKIKNDTRTAVETEQTTEFEAHNSIDGCDKSGGAKNNKLTDDRQQSSHSKQKTSSKALSIRDAFGIGFRGLLKRKVRLAFSVLLASITFVIFGLTLSLATYNRAEIYLDAMYAGNNYFFNITKSVMAEYLTDNDISYLKQKTGKEDPLLSFDMSGVRLSHSFADLPEAIFYDYASLTGTAEINESVASDFRFKLVAGSYPQNDNEIVITEYFFDCFVAAGFYDGNSETVIDIATYSDILGKMIGDGFVIKGIMDTGFNNEKYSELKNTDADKSDERYMTLSESYTNLINGFSAHTLVFVRDGFVENNTHDGIIAAAVPLSGNKNNDKILIELFNPISIDDHPEFFIHKNDIAVSLFELDETLSQISIFLIAVVIVFAALAFVVMLTFLMSVFNDEERTIRILRALGANLKSVFLVYLLLPVALSLFNFLVGTTVCALISNILSAKISLLFLLDYSLINFGILQISAILLLSFLTALFAAIIPLKKHSLI